MPLSPAQTRRFVTVFVVLIVALAALATVLITRGWGNEGVQSQVRQQENERRADMPRFSN